MLAAALPGAVGVTREDFDAARDDPGALLDRTSCGWVINAIGVIKSRIDESDPTSVERAMAVNARFPHSLAGAARKRHVRVIHPTTDGVFAGGAGPYGEDAPHDARDVYAVSKSRGEVAAPHVLNLRCSIVGPERPPGASLLAWLLRQPHGAELTGYANHWWNGVTTLHFSRLCAGIVAGEAPLPGALHAVPADVVTKADLLCMIADAFGRRDLRITRADAPAGVDRSLVTRYPKANALIWEAAGYPSPPSVSAMIRELASTQISPYATSPSSSASGPT
jgi:dTDP-4-dehydrorhamnose reductase